MKTIKIFFLIVVSILYIFILDGCGRSVLDGTAPAPEFDSCPHTFSKTGGEKIIKAKNDVIWSFHSIAINNVYTYGDGFYSDCNYESVEPKYPVKKYSEIEDEHHSLVGEWFTIEELDSKHIRIKMNENKTGEDIYIKVHLFACDAVKNPIIIEQKSE